MAKGLFDYLNIVKTYKSENIDLIKSKRGKK
jgi:hypothetical protein